MSEHTSRMLLMPDVCTMLYRPMTNLALNATFLTLSELRATYEFHCKMGGTGHRVQNILEHELSRS